MEAPTIGEVTPGVPSTQASATCAGLSPQPLRHGQDALEDGVVLLRTQPQRVLEGVGAGADRGRTFARLAAGEKAAAQRAPGGHRDALGPAQGKHLALLLAVDQVEVVLHRDEGGEAAGALDAQHLHELPGPHRGGAEIERLAGLTTSERASTVSSIGVSGSKRWMIRRST